MAPPARGESPAKYWWQSLLYSNAAVLLLVAVCATATYVNTLDFGFTYDDKASILANPDVLSDNVHWTELFRHDFWGVDMWNTDGAAPTWSHNSYRPLTVLSFRLDRLIGGTQATFHVTNVLVHGLACCLAAALCLHEFGRAGRLQAVMASTLFALHPVHVEVVANVTGRAETLSTSVVLAALLCYAKCRASSSQRGKLLWQGLAFALVVAGCLCKETVLIAPVLFVAYEFCHASARGVGQQLWRTLACRRTVATVVFTIALAWFRVIYLVGGYTFEFSPVHNPIAFFPHASVRAMTYAYIQSVNAAILAFPWDLCHEHLSIGVITSWHDLRNLHTAVLWLFLGAAAWFGVVSMQHHPRRHVMRVALVLLVIPFLPASHIVFKVAFVVAERALFLPSLGFTMLLAEVAGFVFRMVPQPRSRTKSWLRFEVPVVLWVAVSVLYARRTWTRNMDWRSETALLEASKHVYPLNANTLHGLGWEALREGRRRDAITLVRRSVLSSQSLSSPFVALGAQYSAVADDRNQGEAISMFVRVAQTGSNSEYLTNAALLMKMRLDSDKQRATAAPALDVLSPLRPPGASLDERLVELQRAESRFAEWTSFIGANNAMTGIGAADAMAQAANIAGCLRLLSTTDRFHDVVEAHRQFMKANQLHPRRWYALYNVGVVHAALGNFSAASVHFETAARRIEKDLAAGLAPPPVAAAAHRAAVRRLHLVEREVAEGKAVWPASFAERLVVLGLQCTVTMLPFTPSTELYSTDYSVD